MEVEKKEANKTQLVLEEKAAEDTSSKTTTYDFEVFDDNHSVTTVTNEKGDTSRYYRAIKDNKFYSLYRNGSETTVPYEGTADITSQNAEEYQTIVDTFGGVKFGYEGSYSGVIDYLYEKTLGDSSIYEQNDEFDPFASSTIVSDSFGTSIDIMTRIQSEDFLGTYAFDIHLYFEFNLYGDLLSATYKRKDYEGIESVDQEITETTAYDYERIKISLTYGEKRCRRK